MPDVWNSERALNTWAGEFSTEHKHQLLYQHDKLIFAGMNIQLLPDGSARRTDRWRIIKNPRLDDSLASK